MTVTVNLPFGSFAMDDLWCLRWHRDDRYQAGRCRRFLAAIASYGGVRGYGGRSRWIRELFGDLLPTQLFARRTKALFDGAFWGPRARAFAASWDGAGADEELVDVAALRNVWARPNPLQPAAVPLQDAWLATQQKQRSSASAVAGNAPPP